MSVAGFVLRLVRLFATTKLGARKVGNTEMQLHSSG